MPIKNKDRDDLNHYKITFSNKESIKVFTPDKLISEAGKADKGGFHPVLTVGDEVFLNLNNVNHIENVTPDPPEDK